MIFKIEIISKDIEKYIKKFSKDFDILYCQNLYIASKNNTKEIDVIEFKQEYKLSQSVNVFKIDETNLGNEEIKVINWCRDKFVLQDLHKFENENQEEIKQYLNFLDSFEDELKKYKNGGETDGK